VRRLPSPVGWARGASAGLILAFLSQVAYANGLPLVADSLHPGWGLGAVACVVVAAFAAGALVVSYEVLVASRRRDPAAFGLARPRRVITSVLIVLGLGVVALPLAVAVTEALGLSGTTAQELGHRSDGYLLFMTFAPVVIAPWVEEVSMRGFVFRALDGRFGFWPAALASAALWAAFHLTAGVLIVFTVAGVLLALLVRRTGSVLPGIAVHGGWNALATGFSGAGELAVAMLVVLLATVALAARWAPPSARSPVASEPVPATAAPPVS
jgi:uncharacterized protein